MTDIEETQQTTTSSSTNTILSLDERTQLCMLSITSIMDKYKHNNFALDRLQRLCVEILPQSVDNYVSQQTDREVRLSKLRESSDSFINTFLESSPEYYYFQNNTFVSYDGEKYTLSSEDQIANRIVMSLSNDNELACRKHKIKTSVIKKIRERGTGHAVPSSYTIQSVLQPLYPSVFETRNETKYFLTIIGDVLTKKHSDLVYFVHHRAKEFIDYVISGLTFLKSSSATALSNLFKYKFQNHDFQTSRVLRIQGDGDSLYYPNINILDLFFVAQYYSNRYESADNLLQQASFSNVARHALILSNLKTEKAVVSWFANEALIQINQNPNHCETKTETETSTNVVNEKTNTIIPSSTTNTENHHTPNFIDAKTIQYMWKRFCQKMKIPNVVQSTSLIPTLTSIETFTESYDPQLKQLNGYVGNRLYNPSVGLFLEFWDDTITHHNSSIVNDIEAEFRQLEIDEIATMFNSWIRKRGHPNTRNGFTMLDEDEIMSCIKHFYPYVSVEDDKFVNDVTCSLWDKQKDVFDFIESQTGLTSDHSTPRTSDSIYRKYCNRTLRTKLCVASKGYFERAYNHIH